MTTKNRLHNKIFWVFTSAGIEDKIYKAVTRKKGLYFKTLQKRFLKFVV